MSGSVSIISEAMHSAMDLIASLIAFIAVKTSSKPVDDEHPYGHGKMENLSGLAEGILIFVAAGLIIKEAINKFMHPSELEQMPLAIAVMLIASLVNLFVSNKLRKVGIEEDSQALEADSLHLRTDVYTSLGVGVGIILVKITGMTILDPIAALLVALLIIKEAWSLTSRAFNFLLDGRLSLDEEKQIKEIIDRHKTEFMDYHKLKTRKSGSKKHIDFHITVLPNMTVQEAHEIIGKIKMDMNNELNNTRVSIHLDPYKGEITE